MSEQSKDQHPTTTLSETAKPAETAKRAETTKLDSTSAAAALALAVTSAAKSGGKPEPEPAKMGSAKTEPAKMEPTKTEPATGTGPRERGASHLAGWRNHAATAAAIAIAIGLGWTGGSQALSGGKTAPQIVPEWAEAAISSIRQTQEDLVRLTGDVRGLKSIIETMKESFDQARHEAAGERRSLMARVDGIERTAEDTVAKIAHVVEASTRIERASAETGARLAAMSGRLDGFERQATAAAAKPVTTAAADGPAQTGSVPDAKVAPKDAPLDGWVLHDVQGGIALVESRNGRLHEVAAGQNLPSVGRVEAIERRGRAWVVVTGKGIIGAPRWQ